MEHYRWCINHKGLKKVSHHNQHTILNTFLKRRLFGLQAWTIIGPNFVINEAKGWCETPQCHIPSYCTVQNLVIVSVMFSAGRRSKDVDVACACHCRESNCGLPPPYTGLWCSLGYPGSTWGLKQCTGQTWYIQSAYVVVIEYLTRLPEVVTKAKWNPTHLGYVLFIVLLLLRNTFGVCNIICGVVWMFLQLYVESPVPLVFGNVRYFTHIQTQNRNVEQWSLPNLTQLVPKLLIARTTVKVCIKHHTDFSVPVHRLRIE